VREGRGGCPDAVAAVALVTAPAESALELARKEYTAGPLEHNPAQIQHDATGKAQGPFFG
jgi:hypothetical protein